ncbi:MAG: malto-oligosyltrehalose synthase [Rhodospirillaceae bacterium]|nr:malto-oligosyltrehalose synthase [Rhodospirillaceae bacterium]
MTAERPPAIPRATYRLQLHAGFDLDAAAAIVPYLAELGISHVYASPFLTARPGSAHGYDITDHNQINPEIGGEPAFDRLSAALAEHAMGLILDFVPNHMGVGGADNPWWLDVLEWGRASPFARFFDIDWQPAEPTLKDKVLLPFLGDHYGNVLERGELKLAFDADAGTFSVWYYGHRFPISPRDYPRVLRVVRDRLDSPSEALAALTADFAKIKPSAQSVTRMAAAHRQAGVLKGRLSALVKSDASLADALDGALRSFEGTPGDHGSFRALHQLLERQAYRISYWRVATAEINYRRFFDINDLAGLRMEEPELFEVSHGLVFRLIAENKIHGLRLDHIDGLYDPAGYCRRLQDRASYMVMQREMATGGAAPGHHAGGNTAVERSHVFYLLVEKILARHEYLRGSWPVDGTTGYEFANQVCRLFVNPAAEKVFTQIYRSFIGRPEVEFEAIAMAAKRLTVQSNLASEIYVIASDLHELAKQSWTTRDFTLPGITQALVEIVTHFPVYRTYITETGSSEEDLRYLDWAISQARRTATIADRSMFDFLGEVLTTDLRRQRGRGYKSRDILKTALKFQQLTGPVTAKAIEDTAFYRYYRLVALNEVGGEPSWFANSPAAFHRQATARLRHHPYGLLATATHDHKRGEDVRARLMVLTEMGTEWRRRVRRWATLNARKKGEDPHGPGRNDEYLIYQMLVGAWPTELVDPGDPGITDLADRMVAYLTKAVREAKVHSSWALPDEGYEGAVARFLRGILDRRRSAAFLADLVQFQRRIAVVGALNGLAQALLKLTAPGVPDIYQGTELWDLSLVDPDNRRPVDYAARRSALARHRTTSAERTAQLLRDWRDGLVKQFTIARALAVRSALPSVFSDGDYQPLEITGTHADRVMAFWRHHRGGDAVVIVPRLSAPLLGDADMPMPAPGAWGTTTVQPAGADAWPVRLVDAFTGVEVATDNGWRLSDLLTGFPLALLSTAGLPPLPDQPG